MTSVDDVLLPSSLREDLRAFVHERDWEKFHDPKNLSMLLASEVGELVALLRWVDNAEADAYAAREPNRSRIAAEMADVTIALLLLADRLKLDLPRAVREKLETNRRNYPVDVARGNSERPAR